MLDAARKAAALTTGKARVEIEGDEVLQLALARLLEILGEAAGKVTSTSVKLTRRSRGLPWADCGIDSHMPTSTSTSTSSWTSWRTISLLWFSSSKCSCQGT